MWFSKRKLLYKQSSTRFTAQRTRLYAAGSRDAEPPSFAEPAVPKYQIARGDSGKQSSSGSDSGCMPGGWGEAEDERASETEECEAMEEQQKGVRWMD